MFSYAPAGKKPIRNQLHDLKMFGQGSKSTAMKTITLISVKYIEAQDQSREDYLGSCSEEIKQKIKNKAPFVNHLAQQIEETVDYRAYQKASAANKEKFRDHLAEKMLEKINTMPAAKLEMLHQQDDHENYGIIEHIKLNSLNNPYIFDPVSCSLSFPPGVLTADFSDEIRQAATAAKLKTQELMKTSNKGPSSHSPTNI